jgi:hypothetical protein
MKKLLLFLASAIISGTIMAQDTLTGWTFPVNNGTDSLNANLGTDQNQGYDLRFQWVDPNDTTVNTVFFTDGATSYAAATTGWDNGANQKYWSIKFKAPGYGDIKVSSAQKSIYSSYDLGPGEFKLQWKISGGTYADVPGGTIQVINDWTTGKVDNLPVPVTNQGSSSVYIRWISTTNNDFNGTTLTPNGISMIDDILVTGTNSSGTKDILFTNRVNIYPVPNNGTFTVESKIPFASLEVLDINGRTIFKTMDTGSEFKVNLGSVSKGVYILKIGFIDTERPYMIKFPVD